MGIYGSDTSTTMGPDGDELDTSGSELDDDRLIAEDILRACTTAAGALLWAPYDSLDVNAQLGKALSPAERGTLARAIQGVLLRDERYTDVDAVVTYDNGVLSIAVSGTTDTGTFSLDLQQDGTTFRVVKTGS